MMVILTLLLAIVALVVSLVSVWFVSVMVKRANNVNKQFYESNIRGSIKLMEDLKKSTEAALYTAGKLEKAEKKDLEVTVGPRITVIEQAAGELRETIDKLQKNLPGSSQQMF